MEPPPIIYDTTQYITTATGNIISRQSKLNGVEKIRLSGKVSSSVTFASKILYGI